MSVRDYYCYKFQMCPGIFNPILFGKRLFQQFAVDTYIKIENSRLDYIWGHQYTIRADLYQGLVDILHVGEGSRCYWKSVNYIFYRWSTGQEASLHGCYGLS